MAFTGSSLSNQDQAFVALSYQLQAVLSESGRCIGQQCDLSRSLYGYGQHPLMFGAVAGYSSRDNLATLRGKHP